MPSFKPLSSGAYSALIQELEAGSKALFGDPFAAGVPVVPSVGRLGKLGRALNKIRGTVFPQVLASLGGSKVTIVRRSRVDDPADPDDPLGYKYTPARTELNAVVAGPTAKTLEKEWLVVPEYEVLIAAVALEPALGIEDAIELDGVSFDVVEIQAFPNHPPAVAYRYVLART